MPKFKYEQEINAQPCDLTRFTERKDRKSYRWVFNDINDRRNFLPIYVLFPDRISKRYTCMGWAISLYETKKQARDRLEYLISNDPNIYLKLGTHTAEGIINEVDGQSCDASIADRTLGHFDHLEYCDIDLSSKFSIVDCIVVV